MVGLLPRNDIPVNSQYIVYYAETDKVSGEASAVKQTEPISAEDGGESSKEARRRFDSIASRALEVATRE